MGGFYWITQNWVIVLNSIGIIGGLFFTAWSLHSDAKTRRVANLLTITTNHRDIWKEPSRSPGLKRILDIHVDILKEPVTSEEAEFVNSVILHTSSVHYAMKDKLLINLEGFCRDICEFFSLPIPKDIWETSRKFQNKDFVEFIERCRSEK